MLTQITRGRCGGVRPPLFIFDAGAGAVVISDQMTREIEKIADRFWHRARGLWLAWLSLAHRKGPSQPRVEVSAHVTNDDSSV